MPASSALEAANDRNYINLTRSENTCSSSSFIARRVCFPSQMLKMLNIDVLFLMFACNGLFAVSELVDKTIHQMQVPRDEWFDIIASKTGTLLSLVETSEISAMGGYDKPGMEQLEDALVCVWKSWVGD